MRGKRYLGGWRTVYFNWKLVQKRKKTFSTIPSCGKWWIIKRVIVCSKIHPPSVPIEYAYILIVWKILFFFCQHFSKKNIHSLSILASDSKSVCWFFTKKLNKVTFCGTRIENELFLDSCFARDLAGVKKRKMERFRHTHGTTIKADRDNIKCRLIYSH
jgi:hypothetical protein